MKLIVQKSKIDDKFSNKNFKSIEDVKAFLKNQSSRYDWYIDDFLDFKNLELFVMLESFIDQYVFFKGQGVFGYDDIIPNVEKLPTIREFRIFNLVNRKLEACSFAKDIQQLFSNERNDLGFQLQALRELDILYKKLNDFKFSSSVQLANDSFYGNTSFWDEKIASSLDILYSMDEEFLNCFDAKVQFVDLGKYNLSSMIIDFKWMLAYILENNIVLKEFPPYFRKPLLSRSVRKRMYVFDVILVNDYGKIDVQILQNLLYALECRMRFFEMAKIWQISLDINSSLKRYYSYFKELHLGVIDFIVNFEKSEVLRIALEKKINETIEPQNRSNVASIKKQLKIALSFSEYKKTKERITTAKQYLNSVHLHIIGKRIYRDLSSCDVKSYRITLEKLSEISTNKERYKQFRILENNLTKLLPNVVDLIHSNDFGLSSIPRLKKAILYKYLYTRAQESSLEDFIECSSFEDMQILIKVIED